MLTCWFELVQKKASLKARSPLLNLACHLNGKIDSGVVSCHDTYVSTLDLLDAEAAKVRSIIR